MLSDELKELIVLLDYGESAGNICSKTLTEIANKNDLKSIFEEIIKFYLVSSSSSTRINASVTLHKLCRRFSNDLSELLSMSASDGYLLTMTSLNLEHLFQQSDSIELLGGKSFLPGLNDNIHKKSWLRRCRKLLHERLGYESGNIDITAAMEFLDDESNVPLLDPQDIIATTTEYSTDRNGDDDAEENNDHDNDDDEDSSESWIARLVRYMTVGLLDPCWESRHGCALGLVSILTGTLASFSDPSSDMKMARYGVQSGRGLPSFLVEDILCHGLCTLLLDRFVDLGYSSSGASSSGSSGTAVSTSPVKEAVGLLLARVSFLNSTTPSSATTFSEGNESLAYQIFTRLSWIASRGLQITESHASSSSSSSSSLYVSVNESLHKNWVVRQGGLIALKHFVSAHFNTLFLDDVTCAQLRLLCEAGLNDPIDDVQNASLGLFLACCRLGIQTSVASSVGTASVSNLLWSLTDALMHSISSLDPLSVRTVSLFHALTALSAVHPVEEVKFVNIQKKLLTLLRLQNALISRLHLFAASTRRNCLLATTSFLSNTLDLIKLLLDASYKVDTTVLVEMIPMVVSIMMSLLRNLTSEASADLGDLHLTSQWDQEKKSISKQATSTNATSSTVPNSGLDSSSHEVSTSSSVSSSVPSDSDAISLVQTSNSLTNNQTISARLGTLIGKIIVELALNRCHGGTLLSDLVVAVVKDSCSFPDSDTIDSNHTISSNKTEKITVGSKSRKRKQTVEEVPIVESAELTHSSAVQGFILSILSNETVKSDFKTTDLYQLNATNFTGLFPDKLLCQLAEFMSGLISPSPECQAEIEARLIQAADVIISAAVKQDENKSMLEHASVKKPAMIRMQLVQEDDGKMLLDSNTSNTSSGKIKSKVSHRSRVLSILSWLSVSIGQVLSTSISNSDLYLFIQRLRKDWEEDKSAKTGRAIWHGGLLRVFGDVQLNAQVQWVKRAVATTAISASEDTIRAMCDHFSYLFLQVYLFRSSQKPERSRQLNELILPSPGSISILCDLL